MGMTDDPYVVANAIYDLFVANQQDLGLKGVFFGEIQMFPETPSLAVEAGRMSRDRAGALNRFENDFTTYLLVYHSPIADTSISQRELLTFTQLIQDVYHASIVSRLLGDPATDDNLLYDGFVSTVEPGFSIRQNSLVRTARLTLHGKSKTQMLT